MSPEERAEAVAAEMSEQMVRHNWVAVVYPGIRRGWAELIASAIREAEASARNEALEEAAVAAAGESGVMSQFVTLSDCQLFNQGVQAAEAAIRNLKTKD